MAFLPLCPGVSGEVRVRATWQTQMAASRPVLALWDFGLWERASSVSRTVTLSFPLPHPQERR